MSASGQITLTNSSAQILPKNLTRVGVILKAHKSNTDTIFVNLLGAAAQTAVDMPIEPGESLYLTSDFPAITAPPWQQAIFGIANSGNQDLRYIEF
jgi:hypothetical protein